jgi:hypothetical protein
MISNRIRFVSWVAAVCIFAVLSACCGTPSTDSPRLQGKQVARFISSEGYCLNRVISGGTHDKHIYEQLPADLDSGSKHDYQIIRGWPVAGSSPVKIAADDLFELTYDSTLQVINLQHIHDPKASRETHTAVLKLEPAPGTSTPGHLLWAWGRAIDRTGKDVGGEYYVYSLADSLPCAHRNRKPGKACKSVHFEFFLDGQNANEKPGAPGVVEHFDPNLCSGGDQQASEGDGDHGPN